MQDLLRQNKYCVGEEGLRKRAQITAAGQVKVQLQYDE